MPATNKLDFSNAQAAAKALKKVSTIMIRAGQPVVSSEFIDKARRVAGVTYREASLTVASGQVVVLRVNVTGDIFQVVLNGSVQPMKNQTDSDKAVIEIAALLEKGQSAFQKAQARKAIALPKGMSTPAPKQAKVYAERVAQLDTQIAERQATVADLQQQLGAMTDSLPPAVELDDAAKDVLAQLQAGAVEDGDLVSKQGRDTLVEAKLAGRDDGANWLTAEGEKLAAALLDGIGGEQPKGFPRKWGGKLYNFDQFKLAPADEHGELPGAWTLIDGAVPVADSLLDAIEQPQDEELTVSGAYVAAREIVLADPAMLDSVATAGAIEQLRQALSVVETNAPINEAEGNLDQAKLERSLAKSFITAIAMLDSVNPDFGDSGLSELVNIAIVSAADVSDIKDEDALAQLLALGMVETAEGLYMLTAKGRSALEDAGFDAYGEPFAAED
jgi:ribosomal protein S19E (S16A)